MQGRFCIWVLVPVIFISSTGMQAQQTRIYTDPLAQYKQAKEFFQKEQYSLAHPLFKELKRSQPATTQTGNRVINDELDFYTIASGLQQNEGSAVTDARQFIAASNNTPLNQKLSYHLGEYYFRQNDPTSAITYYEQSSIGNLSNRQIADQKFHQGYAYFTLQQFDKARPLLATIAASPNDPNYKDANYYYGFISYYDRRYDDALKSFKLVEDHPQYGRVVPFYLASIYYFKGEKDKAREYAEASVKKRNGHYDLQLKQLIGHAYFERKEYEKALPYLQEYASKATKLTRDDIYELSFCHYMLQQHAKAVEGFKQLTQGQDSLSQSAMYLLGDAYLKLGQKANARNAFAFCAANSSNPAQKEVSQFNYAKLSYELGYQDIALAKFQEFLATYPNSTYKNEAQENLVGLLANTNNYREAVTLLESVKQPGENVRRLIPRVWYGRAMELINDDQLEDARILLEKAVKDRDNGAVAGVTNFWLGEIAYRQNRLDDATRYYLAYLSNPGSPNGDANPKNVRYNLGYCYYRRENYKQALNFFEQVNKTAALNTNEVDQDAWVRSADCYFMNRDFSRARSMYNQAVSYSWPSSDYATYQLAMITGVNNPKEKVELMKAVTRRYPGSSLGAEVNLEIAKTLMAEEKFREAIPYLTQILQSATANTLKPEVHLKLGLCYLNIDKNSEALENFKKVVAQYPGSPEAEDAVDNVKSIYVQQGRPAEFVDFMRSAGRTVEEGEEEQLSFNAAQSRFEEKDYNGALKALNNYIQQFPDGAHAVDAWFLRSEVYNLRKDWKNASAGYAEVAGMGPGKYADRAALGAGRIFYFELQDYESAEKYFLLAKENAGTREAKLDAMRGLLRSQYQLRKWEQAAGNAQELLKEKNTSVDDKVLAYIISARSKQSKRDFSGAIQDYRNVVSNNKAAYAAEARYEIAQCYISLDDLKNAEKAAFDCINKSGSYDFWITKAYILLGDVFLLQKDYFNAKATLQSVVDNSSITELKNEAQSKLNKVMTEEKEGSKLGG